MDRTNYPLLSIVAIVAITAIVAIFLYARAGEGITPPKDAVTGLFTVEITGRVTDGGVRAPSAPKGNPIDLDGNGKLDVADSQLLAAVIDRAQFCPRNKRCDLNTDGRIDMDDLGILNSEIIKQKAAAYVPAPQQTRNEPEYEPAIDDAVSIAAFGGLL